ncbi:MAG: hypothetical protein KDA71_24050, partial [Planctomycetales bacterium]|nr:hypothetical protein [Planctomycetales bacterium]
MMDRRLSRQLEMVAARIRRLRFWQAVAIAWLLPALVGAAWWALNWRAGWSVDYAAPTLGIAALLAGVAAAAWSARAARDPRQLARRIEDRYPELKASLVTAVEIEPQLPHGRLGFLQESVVREALLHAYRHPWTGMVSSWRLFAAFAANMATLVLLLVVLLGITLVVAPSPAIVESEPVDAQTVASGGWSVTVEPGDTEIERGTSLLVMARFVGALPTEATLVYRTADGEAAQLPMTKSLDDPIFGGRIPNVTEPLDYHVQLPGHETDSYHVGVFEYPRLVRGDARLSYPAYTNLEPRVIEDVRTVSAVEGTDLTIVCHLNKMVSRAVLIDAEQPNPIAGPLTIAGSDVEADAEGNAADDSPLVNAIPLTAESTEPPVYSATLRLEKSKRLRLELVDEQGRGNVTKEEFVIRVLPNKPPELKLTFPGRDVRVSPLEETDVQGTVWDDYGVTQFGISYAMAGGDEQHVTLGENAAAKQTHAMQHMIQFEQLRAEPDQLLSYYLWAEDIGPDGEPRRVLSDMYFAEVRPFEEIFRQGEQPPGGQQQQQQQQQQGSQNAQQAEQLADLQKQIINATWKLIRRETADEPTEPFAGDAELIYQSQGSALEQANELVGNLEDAESQSHGEAVLRAMNDAFDELRAAKDGPALSPLRPALAAEQAAYQALLRLRAREHNVIRSQQQAGQQGQSSSSSNRSQQQLDQLDLSNDENRYETERTAESQSQQELQDRETRQVLNRLSELARRQNDLNERLKELQSALEEAQTEAEREELRRQLQRLTEEQQQILRDTDELQSRMESPENQQRMNDERQQLEQTREQVRRASEALEEGMVPQATAAGARAEQQFEDLRNELRRQASNRFEEELREMRDDARGLEQRQQQLAEQLNADESEENANSLRDDSSREELPEQLREQQQRLQQLLERMRETTLEAEATEPLLSERLYEAARDAAEQNLERALPAAESSLRRGLIEDAQQQEQLAREGIRQLREGIEQAAESVLGDDTEALRRAREELERLADELNDEVARNTGEPPAERRSRQPRESGEPGDAEAQRRSTPNGVSEPNGESDQQTDSREPTSNGPSNQNDLPRENSRNGGNPTPTGEQPERQSGSPSPSGSPAEQNGEQPAEQPSQSGQQPGEGQPNGQQPSQQPTNQPGQQPSHPGSPASAQAGSDRPGGAQPGQSQSPNQTQPGQQPTGGGQPNQQGGPFNDGGFNAGGFAPFMDESGRPA